MVMGKVLPSKAACTLRLSRALAARDMRSPADEGGSLVLGLVSFVVLLMMASYFPVVNDASSSLDLGKLVNGGPYYLTPSFRMVRFEHLRAEQDGACCISESKGGKEGYI